MRVRDNRPRNLMAIRCMITGMIYYGLRLQSESENDWWNKIRHGLKMKHGSKLIQSIRDHGIMSHEWKVIAKYTNYAKGEEHMHQLIRIAGANSLNGR